MFYALDTNGERRQPRAKKDRAFCPGCHAEVIAKFGTLTSHHWAHKARSDCDSWSEHEGPWHLGWKTGINPDHCEVVIGSHRADILGRNGVVVELQHSPISPEMIAEREAFYGRMVWVVDAQKFDLGIGAVAPKKIIHQVFPLKEGRWYHPARSWLTATKPMFWDVRPKDGLIYRFVGFERWNKETYVTLQALPKQVFFYRYLSPHGIGQLNQVAIEHTRKHIDELLSIRSAKRKERERLHRRRMESLSEDIPAFERALRTAEAIPPLERDYETKALLRDRDRFLSCARGRLRELSVKSLNKLYRRTVEGFFRECPRWEGVVLEDGAERLKKAGPAALLWASKQPDSKVAVAKLLMLAKKGWVQTPMDKHIIMEGDAWLEDKAYRYFSPMSDEDLYTRVRRGFSFDRGEVLPCREPAWTYVVEHYGLPLLYQRAWDSKPFQLPNQRTCQLLLLRAESTGRIVEVALTRTLSEFKEQVALETAVQANPDLPLQYGAQPLVWDKDYESFAPRLSDPEMTADQFDKKFAAFDDDFDALDLIRE